MKKDSPMRMTAAVLAVLLLLPLASVVASNDSGAESQQIAISQQDHGKVETSNDEIVSFNKSSLKYHCRTCTWAKRCTQNCISMKKSEAIKRGGVACKVCGGSCR